MISISSNLIRCVVLIIVAMFMPGLTGLAAQERIVDGREIREAIGARLAQAGEIAAPSLMPQKKFFLCDGPLRVEPAFGGWRSVNVICPSPAEWRIAVRAQVKGAAPLAATPAEVSATQAVFLTRPLRRGDRIQAMDVELRPVDPLSSASVFGRLSDVIGRVLNQSMSPHMPVMARHLAREWSVEEEDPLELVVVRGGIEILSSGIALDAGQLGDTIRVANTRSGTPLLGRIVGEKKVEVIAKGRNSGAVTSISRR